MKRLDETWLYIAGWTINLVGGKKALRQNTMFCTMPSDQEVLKLTKTSF